MNIREWTNKYPGDPDALKDALILEIERLEEALHAVRESKMPGESMAIAIRALGQSNEGTMTLEKSYEMSIKALEEERAKLVAPIDQAITLLRERLAELPTHNPVPALDGHGDFTVTSQLK